MPSNRETRIQELHLTLPAPPQAGGQVHDAVLVGNMLYVRPRPHQGGRQPDPGALFGTDLTLEQGKDALASPPGGPATGPQTPSGSLDKVKRL